MKKSWLLRKSGGRSRSRRVLLSWVAVLLGSAPAGAQADLPQDKIEEIDRFVASKMAEYGVPAVSAAVGSEGEVVWTDGYGMADLENNVPATARTLFRTASVSKWMTATATMQLMETGHLDLDVPVQRYCPQYPEKRWTLTTRHLLSHRGGVRHYVGSNGEDPATLEERERLMARVRQERLGMSVRYTDVLAPLDRFKDDPLIFEPGTRFHYTSFGYRLLGCVIQGASGTPYWRLMEERVFEPAGMAHTRADDALAIIPFRVSGYQKAPDGTLLRAEFRDVSENLPAGGHLSTAADLVRFAMAFHDGVLVRPATRERMIAPPRFPNADPDAEPDENAYYGFGVNVGEWEGRAVLFHGGAQAGTSTFLLSIPSEDIHVAVMVNVTALRDLRAELAYGIAAIVLGVEATG